MSNTDTTSNNFLVWKFFPQLVIFDVFTNEYIDDIYTYYDIDISTYSFLLFFTLTYKGILLE